MKLSQFFPFDAAKRAIGKAFRRAAIVDHMQAEPVVQAGQNADGAHRLASGPETKLIEAGARQFGAADRGCWSDKNHRSEVNVTLL
jgi:hypothetical protein